MRQGFASPVGISPPTAASSRTTLDWRFKMLSYEEVSELLEYRPDVGGSCLVWKRSSGRAFIGHRAGSPDPKRRYWRLKLLGKLRSAHQIVWLLNTKAWPEKHLDHVDGDPENNTFTNLRLCSRAENLQNQSRNRKNASGRIGAHWRKDAGKWVSEIQIEGKRSFLGYFSSAEEAHNAYLEAKAKLHTFNPVPR